MSDSICVIHDSKVLRDTARAYLEASGFAVADAADSGGALSRIGAVEPALFLLQWTGGTETEAAMAKLRSRDALRASRIIVIAAQADIGDAIGVLEHGADDCLPVPFTPGEILGRVNASLRRPRAAGRGDCVRAGPLLLDRVAHRLIVSEETVALAPAEFRLMAFFIAHQGRAFTRHELLQQAWPRHVRAGRRTVDVNVRRLRQALERFACDHMIQTVRGYGYRFSLDGERSSAQSISPHPAAERL